MTDNLVWLSEQRDKHAAARDECYGRDDWATGNEHNHWVERFFACIQEITEARKRLAVFSEVLQKRILLAAANGEGGKLADPGE